MNHFKDTTPLYLAFVMVIVAAGVLVGISGQRDQRPAALIHHIAADMIISDTTATPARPMPATHMMTVIRPGSEETMAVTATTGLPTPSAIAQAVLLPTVTSTPAATPTAAPQPARASVELTGFRHEWQTWNNCGPATLAMNLSFYGSSLGQADIGAVLRQYPDDKNVSPEELVTFAQTQGYQAQMRVNGNADEARLFLSNGIPFLIETWLEPKPHDGMGHYRLLTGYDDATQNWVAYDAYVSTGLVNDQPDHYQGIYLPYAETEHLWAVFNHTYLLIYPAVQEPLVRSILGDAFDETVMWENALQTAQKAIADNPNDPYAWFNLGTDTRVQTGLRGSGNRV